MIRIIKAAEKNIDDVIRLRLEMLREVNSLPGDYSFGESFVSSSKSFFLGSSQTTYLAYEDEAVGCTSICYYDVMPTYAHPSGKRAHIMNVYTKKDFRKQGIASTLLYMLIDEAKEKGVTEITLDAADDVKSLYYKNGFLKSEEGMVMDINRMLRLNIERAERTGCKLQHC